MNPKHFIPYFSLLCLLFTLGCAKEEAPSTRSELAQLPDGVQIPKVDWAALEREAALDWQQQLVEFREEGNVIEVPAGSVDALAAAIEEAGDGGTVLVKAGEHSESGTVTISSRVRLIGEPGAVLIVDTKPAIATPTTYTDIDPALYVFNIGGVMIRGLDIRPTTAPGGTAVLVEDAPRTTIRNNKMTDFQFSVLVEQGDRSRIIGNTIVCSGAWQTGELAETEGIVVSNGDAVLVYNNDVSNGLFGIWACDKNGFCLSNNTHGNFLGIVLCKVPEGALPLPSGKLAGAELSATGWLTQANTSTGNAAYGILVIDGANHNFVIHNELSNNGAYDIELTTDTYRFGFLTPMAFDNYVITAKKHIVKDCGENNTIIGGTLVDTGVDGCN